MAVSASASSASGVFLQHSIHHHMRIGLVDVDGHNFPNFALMKISAFHKAKGDNVEWAMPMFGQYDRVYQSKIFTFTPDEQTDWRCEVVKGGTGYDIRRGLADEIEASTRMDYSIYPQYPFSIQFFSRGCIRRCPFCLVHDKEGEIHAVDGGPQPCGSMGRGVGQ